jgi:hypothetical protein
VPGLQNLFFARMGGAVSEAIQQELEQCLAQYGERRS